MSTHSWEYFSPVGHRYPIEDRAAAEEGRAVPKRQPPPEVLTPRESKLARFTPGYPMPSIGELMYFPLRARGEALRLLLNYTGLAYTQRTVDFFEEWPTLKPTVPKNYLPQFTPFDMGEEGDMFPESVDIAKHVAKLAAADKPGLYPSDATAAAQAERLFAMCMDDSSPCMHIFPVLQFFPVDEATPKIAGAVKAAIGALKELEPELVKGGPFFGGVTPHYGDIAIFNCIDHLVKLDSNTLTTLGATWAKLYAALSEVPAIARYLKSRPKAGTGKVGAPGSILATQTCGE